MGSEEVLKAVEEGRYMEALEGLWKLGDVYGFHSLFPRGDSPRKIVLGACRQAVEALRRGDLERVRSWLERLRGDVPPGIVDLGDGAERASWRARVVRAHLLCVEAALEMHWPSWTVGKGALEEIARECGLQGCFVEEIAGAVLGLSGREVKKKESVTALLVSGDREGVAGYLELEVLGSGRGELFPSSEMAFVFRDREFLKAEGNACAWAYENGWNKSTDVRWRLKLPDGRTPTSLSGGSAGGAFAVGLAKLFSKSAELIELGGTAVSAAVDKEGKLRAVHGLWEKLGAAVELGRRGLLHTLVVSDEQGGVPEEYREEGSPFQVIQAGSVEEALGKLYEETGPRVSVQMFEEGECRWIPILDRVAETERFYQVPVLLRRIEEKELPRENGGRSRPGDVLSWEREARRKAETTEEHTLEEVLKEFGKVVREAGSGVPRLVVLGPPGAGKSTLCRYLSWGFASGKLEWNGRRLIPARVSLRDWQRRHGEKDLPGYLAELYKNLKPKPEEEQWVEWMHRGEVVLLLDGLDEIEGDPGFEELVRRNIKAFPNCPTFVTCRSVSFERYKSVCGELPVFMLPGLSEEARDRLIGSYPAENPDKYDSERVKYELRSHSVMWELASNPLILTLICYLVDDPEGLELPTTRAKLYEGVFKKLLGRSRVQVKYPGEPPGVDEKMAVLERAAFGLFEAGRLLTFKRRELVEQMKTALKEEGYTSDIPVWAGAFVKDFTENAGVIRSSGDGMCFFLHPTLHEYLTASWIARKINTEGWESRVRFGGEEVSLKKFVSRKAWDPGWEEVILLLAGSLEDAGPLLEMLSDEKPTEENPYGDDFFRHRLGLAGLCLGELGEEQKGKLGDKLSVVTAKVFGGWYKQGFLQTLQHMEKALKSLARCNAFVREGDWRRWVGEHPAVGVDAPSFLDWVAKMVEDPIGRFVAILAVGLMGGSAARPDVLSLFTELLKDEDANTRRAATLASMGLGFSPVTREIFLQIVELLKDEDGYVRRAAAEAVGSIGSSAAVPEFLDQIAKLLEDKRAYVRDAAVEAVGKMGSTAATTEILSRIAKLLEDRDSYVRYAAASAVGEMGSTAATTEILSRIAKLLEDEDDDVRYAAASAVGEMDSTAARIEILSRIAELLKDERGYVCDVAIWAVVEMGSTAATTEFLSQIAKLLEDRDWYARDAAIWAVGKMGSTAATTEILSRIAKLLEDERWYVRDAAAEAVEAMGIRLFRRGSTLTAERLATLTDPTR